MEDGALCPLLTAFKTEPRGERLKEAQALGAHRPWFWRVASIAVIAGPFPSYESFSLSAWARGGVVPIASILVKHAQGRSDLHRPWHLVGPFPHRTGPPVSICTKWTPSSNEAREFTLMELCVSCSTKVLSLG